MTPLFVCFKGQREISFCNGKRVEDIKQHCYRIIQSYLFVKALSVMSVLYFY